MVLNIVQHRLIAVVIT